MMTTDKMIRTLLGKVGPFDIKVDSNRIRVEHEKYGLLGAGESIGFALTDAVYTFNSRCCENCGDRGSDSGECPGSMPDCIKADYADWKAL